ncbi:kinesin-like protein KIN-8A isoform X2 [Cryptomeria japonica]|uniref:kinesin-like protein KIN-8A isoform X2 n=1 Tax=Cryptomeria japonica TaxID=3369 RepID=UPI0027DA0942|nr:kinesin-like protein KIN-8A isoform X2 [Cryptomeria japonica]
MPVATRSHSVTSPGALRRRLKEDEHDQGHNSAMRNPHYKLKEKMRYMAESNESSANNNSTTKPLNQPLKTSHASIDLLSPQVTSVASAEKRKSKISQNPEKTDALQVLGQCNFIKEQRGRESNLERLVLSCPKPLPSSGSTAVARRLTMIGVGHKESKCLGGLVGGQLETISEGGVAKGGEQGARIMVYVRLRPMSRKEKEAGCTSCVRVVNKRDVYITEYGMETDYLRLKRVKGRHFAFDVAFPDVTGQEEVYRTTTADLVEGVLQGRNGSVFCYGATGAGKTYTMLGTIQNPGVMVLAIKDLFMKLRQRSCNGHHVVRLSYLEVYNETVRDLLSPGRPLVLREDKQGIVAAGLTQYQAYSTDEVMSLLQQGNQNRTTEPTRMNETSSRSHAILQVVAEYTEKEGSATITRVGKLSLIDLAGSERALATDLRTVRSLEGANINRSLLALSSCINALVEGKKHIPYRNSKLTQLLKDSLGGACHTVMIANISPSIQTFGETQNTLHWADRAKEIRTKASVAHEEFQHPETQTEQLKLLLEVQKENQQLRTQIARYQQKILTLQSQCVTSSPALSSCSIVPSSPLTPAAIETQMTDRYYSKINQCSTPEPTPRRLSYHDGGKAAEEVIKDLKRKIRTLEVDNQNLNKEYAIKEKKLKAEITDLKREHSLQLKQKDDFIRKLCQKSSFNQSTQKSSPQEKEETLSFTQPNDKNNALKSTILISSSSAKLPSERLRKIMPLMPEGNNTNSLPRNVCDSSLRMGRRVQYPSDAGSLKSPRQSNRFKSPGPAPVGRKRTFWDITNANSPSAVQIRSTRTHRNDAPSMLLQPGFACHRQSLN